MNDKITGPCPSCNKQKCSMCNKQKCSMCHGGACNKQKCSMCHGGACNTKTQLIPEKDSGLLNKYNYVLKNNFEERIKSLKKANKELSKLKVLRYINALRTLHKSNEKYYKKLDRDMKWLQENYN